KTGRGGDAPDVTLNLKYGMLQSNVLNGRAPQHNHMLNILGGMGPGFSYAGSVSYNYSGAWQPGLFTRRYGASLGATHTRGPLIATGNVATTASANGSYVAGGSQYCTFGELG